jgi:branched-chain amino acid transport system ATP-binding protein
VPEHRGIFRLLTVEENQMLGQAQVVAVAARRCLSHLSTPAGAASQPEAADTRRGGGRARAGDRREIVAQLRTIKVTGVSILLVGHNLEVCTQVADRHDIIDQGEVV